MMLVWPSPTDIKENIDIGVVWVYGTGNSITLPIQQYNSSSTNQNPNAYWPTSLEYFDKKNDYKIPAYHRLDVGINLHKEKKWGEAVWSFGLYNAYSRQNPFYVEYGFLMNDFSFNPQKVLKQISLFPIIPSISYSFKF